MSNQINPASATASPATSAGRPGSFWAGRVGARSWLIVFVLVLLLASGIVAVWWISNSRGTIRYATTPVTHGSVVRTVTATGTVNPVLTIIVGTYVSGVIKELHCDFNTQVKQGQVCAKIDPRPYQTLVDQHKANLAMGRAQLQKDKATLHYAEHTYDRQRRLVQTNAASQDAADNAESLRDQAQAQIELDLAMVEQRLAQLAAAQVNLDYTDIISPVDGTVVSRNVTMGQTVAASFQTPTLFLIATDLTKMQVETNVSESDIGGVKAGNKAAFTVDAFPRRVFDGLVTQVRQSPQTVQNIVTYDVVVSVDNPELILKPGMTAATKIVIDQRHDVLRVPNQALRYSPGGPSGSAILQPGGGSTDAPVTSDSSRAQLWVLREGQPQAIPVELGLDDDTFTEIVKGEIQAGDRVILSAQTAAGTRSPTPLPRF